MKEKANRQHQTLIRVCPRFRPDNSAATLSRSLITTLCLTNRCCRVPDPPRLMSVGGRKDGHRRVGRIVTSFYLTRVVVHAQGRSREGGRVASLQRSSYAYGILKVAEWHCSQHEWGHTTTAFPTVNKKEEEGGITPRLTAM